MEQDDLVIRFNHGLAEYNTTDTLDFIHALEAHADVALVSLGFSRTGTSKQSDYVELRYRQFGVALPGNVAPKDT